MPGLLDRIGTATRRAMASLTIPWDGRQSLFAYKADDLYGQEVSGWLPWIRSPDSEINLNRDRRVARVRDLVRNDGWAAGGADRIVDDTVGGAFRLIAKPDYLSLQRACPAMDGAWADEFGQAVQAEWRLWGDDPGRHCDGGRRLTMPEIFGLALRHKLNDGEALAALLYFPDFVGQFGARYATTVQLIDPDRLSNPSNEMDTRTLRGGVEVDGLGAPVAYHIRRAHQNDYYNAAESMIWDRIPRETPWGRPMMVHDFDMQRTGQSRGVPILAPVLSRFRMLSKYDAAELAQALQQTAIRTFIQSPFDHEQLASAMQSKAELSTYQSLRHGYHDKNRITLDGSTVIPRLYPGETIGSVPVGSPGAQFDNFEHAVLRSIAAVYGTSAEQLTKDFSRANYSSIRASLLDTWRTMQRRRTSLQTGFCNPIYGAFLEEAMERTLKSLMPRNAPPYAAWRAAYTRCTWIGPARGWVDPVKERQGAVLGLDAAFSTLERECAEQGLEWRETVEQRAREVKVFKDLGLALPDWGGQELAEQAEKKPVPL